MHYWYFNNNNNNNNNDCQYDENFYPDIMTRTKKSEVNAMASSGTNWQWPKQDSIIFVAL